MGKPFFPSKKIGELNKEDKKGLEDETVREREERERLNDIEQDRKERKKYAHWSYWIVSVWLGCIVF